MDKKTELIAYALFTKRGGFEVICEKLPIYWYKKVAVEDAIKYRAVVKKVKLIVEKI